MGETCSTRRRGEKCVQILVGRSRRRCEDNIRMDRRKTVWQGVDWINLAQDMVQWRTPVNTLLNIRVS